MAFESSSSSPSQVNDLSARSFLNSQFNPTLNSAISIKLDRDNYSVWRSQVIPAINGHNLRGFINGTKQCPPEFVETVNSEGVKERAHNFEYDRWMREDQLLLSWLLSSLSTTILRSMTRITTSRGVWSALESRFAVNSKARVMPLKLQLQSTRKGNLSISDYVAKMEAIADALFLAGCNVSEDYLITSILMGLPSEYDVIVAMISNRLQNCDQNPSEVTVQEVLAMALSQETRIEQQNAALDVNIQGANANYSEAHGR